MAEINIIPLVDITLVLLIIFMATTAFVKEQDRQKDEKTQPELPLQLPQSAASVESPVSSDLLILGIDKQGRKYLGSTPISTEALHARVREAALKNPHGRVRIDADRDTRFQDIVEVIELCQFEGLRHVGLHTAKEQSP